mgnify:CR=1 FL=1
MPLSNAQYDEIMHEYDERQLHNRHILETRRAEAVSYTHLTLPTNSLV